MRGIRTLAALMAFSLLLNGCARSDLVLDDFERDSFLPWIPLGTAFALGPAGGAIGDQRPVASFHGSRLVNTFSYGDGATGYLISPEFTIERKYINFLIGGGNIPGSACLELYIGGEKVASATGTASHGGDSEHLRWVSWNVMPYIGRSARIVVVDQATDAWGHLAVDYIVQSDRRAMKTTDNPKVQEAWNSVLGAVSWAEEDPRRPTYHFRPPALWMNDPNAPLLYEGWYHLFYQHNPFGDRWDTMYWGHARSRDMVTWEHLPVALWPSIELGEVGAWSGCAALDEKGKPMLFYTSIKASPSARDYAEQWIVRPRDEDLIAWEKPPANPIMTPAINGDQIIYEWRDPFMFRLRDRAYMVLGGNIQTAADQYRGVVALYEGADPTLGNWQYRGILYQHPTEANIECPNFFPLGDQFVLVMSLPGWRAEYTVGTFNEQSGTFAPRHSGMIDHGEWYYAPTSTIDAEGRRVMWGWVRGFPDDKGWNGVQSLPRILTLAEDGGLNFEPLPALQKLRGKHTRIGPMNVNDGTTVISQVQGDTLELRLTIEAGSANRFGLLVRTNENGVGGTAIVCDGSEVRVDGDERLYRLQAPGAPVDLRVFLDRSVIEIFVNGRACFTRVIDVPPDHQSIALFAEGGKARLSQFDAWAMSTAFPEERGNLEQWSSNRGD
ncbi:glycoside hydrolase family 32 protein [bacterium]|nr:glycoside hydrolase family 32 protein [bacterium]